MAVQLPDQCPTAVTYTPPSHPTRQFRSQSGATYRMLFGDRSSGARLDLEYQISNQGQRCGCGRYEEARGEFEEVLVDDEQWAGDDGIAATVPSHIRWHFAEPPQVERVFKDRARLRVVLTGDLEAT